MSDPVLILTFHHIRPEPDKLTVPPSLFRSILQHLKESYAFISYQDFIDFWTGRKPVSGKTILLTMDDGYLDNYIYAFPILRELSIPSVIFPITGLIESSSTCRRRVDFIEHKTLKNERDSAFFINSAELADMRKSQLVSFASHTHSHMLCKNRTEKDLLHEFTTSHQALLTLTGDSPPYGFCWPGGEFDRNALSVIRKTPYTFAFSTIEGACFSGDDAYTIRRIDCSSFSGDIDDYQSRIRKKLSLYNTPIIGKGYSSFKHFRTKLQSKRFF